MCPRTRGIKGSSDDHLIDVRQAGLIHRIERGAQKRLQDVIVFGVIFLRKVTATVRGPAFTGMRACKRASIIMRASSRILHQRFSIGCAAHVGEKTRAPSTRISI